MSNFWATYQTATANEETSTEILLNYKMPGVKKNTIKLIIEDNTIKVTSQNETRKYVSSYNIPSIIEQDAIEAKYENGVLSIKLPKLVNCRKKLAREVKIH